MLLGYACFVISDIMKLLMDKHKWDTHARVLDEMTQVSQFFAPTVVFLMYSYLWYTVCRSVSIIGTFIKSQRCCALFVMKMMPGLILFCIGLCFMLVFEGLRPGLNRIIPYINKKDIRNGSYNLSIQYIIMLLLV